MELLEELDLDVEFFDEDDVVCWLLEDGERLEERALLLFFPFDEELMCAELVEPDDDELDEKYARSMTVFA